MTARKKVRQEVSAGIHLLPGPVNLAPAEAGVNAPFKALIYAPRLADFSYGPAHPFRSRRLTLTFELMREYGLLRGDGVAVIDPPPATEEELLAFHDPAYVRALRRAEAGHVIADDFRFGLGTGDNPVFPGLWRYCLLYAGGSLAAARLTAAGKARAAFSMAGGLHHAHAGRASGFCYVNDCVLAIMELLKTFDRVLYLDVDAHHGDGVQEAFYGSNRVLTVSFHESGRYLFPGTGFETEQGEGAGRGFALNFPFLPGVGNGLWLECLTDLVGAVLDRFRPEAIVLQLGVDSLRHDPLAHLSLTNRAPAETVRLLKASGLPLVILGGGGYDSDNVARAWTLAWAVLLGVEPPDRLPPAYLKMREEEGSLTLRDRNDHGDPLSMKILDDAHHLRDYLLARVVPLIHDRGGR